MEKRIAEVSAAAEPKARLAAAAALRLQLFREAEAILFQDAFPVIPIYFYVVTGVVQPWVEGFHTEVPDENGRMIPNLQDLHPFRNVRIRKGAR
jgi:ABC-type oligopeptide transport system substrate-binding subunit